MKELNMAIKIPNFPEYRPLYIEDQLVVNKWIREHPPYSDYNFTSMWTWDIDGTLKISQLQGNLVVIFSDYISSEKFFSFIGTQSINNTINQLVSYSKHYGLSEELRLIPESVIQTLRSESIDGNIKIEEDDVNHDYVLSVEKMITMSGKKLGPKRNFINRFKKKYGDITSVQSLNLTDPKIKKDILNLFCTWQKKAGKTCKETNEEYKAIIRTLENAHRFDLYAVGIYIDDKLVAFSIDEILHDQYGIIHYEKADIEKVGIYQFLKQQCAKIFFQKGCKYINYEQDLGIHGLRKAKRSHAPVNMLKKYKISPISLVT